MTPESASAAALSVPLFMIMAGVLFFGILGLCKYLVKRARRRRRSPDVVRSLGGLR